MFQVPLNIPLNLTPMPNNKITNENSENINNVPPYQTLIYSIPTSVNGTISVLQ